MAAGAGEIRGSRRVVDRLLVPRPLTRAALLLFGLALAQTAWVYLSRDLLAYVSGVAAPFCLLCAGAVWGMRDKLDAAIDGGNMDAEEYRRTVHRASGERRRFMRTAAWVAVCACAAAGPAISVQLTQTMWHWMVLAAGVGVGESAFSYLLANRWDEELRAFRARRLIAAKEADERRALEARIEATLPASTPEASGGWVHRADEEWPGTGTH
jgi:hypothetical protein